MRIPEGEPVEVQYENNQNSFSSVMGKRDIPIPNHFSFADVIHSIGGNRPPHTPDPSSLPKGIAPTEHTPALFGPASLISGDEESDIFIDPNIRPSVQTIYDLSDLSPDTQTF